MGALAAGKTMEERTKQNGKKGVKGPKRFVRWLYVLDFECGGVCAMVEKSNPRMRMHEVNMNRWDVSGDGDEWRMNQLQR